jgi:multicomponent Na+:H+ antiporter subunit E
MVSAMGPDAPRTVPASRWVVATVSRGVALAALWWVVSEGSTLLPLPLAAGVVAVATVASLAVAPPRRPVRVRALPLLRFAGWFVLASLRGGTDVGLRALSSRMRLDPGVVEYPLAWPDRRDIAVLLADVVSLLPGTLAVAIGSDRLVLHVLDRRLPVDDEMGEAERRIAAVLGVRSG